MRRITESELIRLVRRVIKEETSGLGDFIETLRSNFNMSDELVGFISYGKLFYFLGIFISI